MARTQTTLTEQEVLAAFEELRTAADKFQSAVLVFGAKYDADTVSIVAMAELVGTWMYDIDADIAATFDSDEE